MAKLFKNYINGQWKASSSGETFKNTNPANHQDVVGRFQKSNARDVQEAIAAAEGAQKKWRATPAPKRGEILFKVAELLLKEKESLAEDMTREMGKVIGETRGDVQEAVDLTYYTAGEGRRLLGETVPSELPDKFCMSVRMPVGIVSAITPWNFPIAIPSWKLIPALVCGNTVVIKPATDTPLSVVNFMKIFEKAGLPRSGEHGHRFRHRSRHANDRKRQGQARFLHRIDRYRRGDRIRLCPANETVLAGDGR